MGIIVTIFALATLIMVGINRIAHYGARKARKDEDISLMSDYVYVNALTTITASFLFLVTLASFILYLIW